MTLSSWALTFILMAVLCTCVGFNDLTSVSAAIAQTLAGVFLVLSVIALIVRMVIDTLSDLDEVEIGDALGM